MCYGSHNVVYTVISTSNGEEGEEDIKGSIRQLRYRFPVCEPIDLVCQKDRRR